MTTTKRNAKATKNTTFTCKMSKDGRVSIKLNSMDNTPQVYWTSTKNSFVCAEVKDGAWLFHDGTPVDLYSVNGIGEIRWPVKPSNLEGNIYSGGDDEEMEVVKHFGLTVNLKTEWAKAMLEESVVKTLIKKGVKIKKVTTVQQLKEKLVKDGTVTLEQVKPVVTEVGPNGPVDHVVEKEHQPKEKKDTSSIKADFLKMAKEMGLEVTIQTSWTKVTNPGTPKLRVSIANKGNEAHCTFVMKNGFCEVLTDEEAKAKKMGGVRTIIHLDKEPEEACRAALVSALKFLKS